MRLEKARAQAEKEIEEILVDHEATRTRVELANAEADQIKVEKALNK